MIVLNINMIKQVLTFILLTIFLIGFTVWVIDLEINRQVPKSDTPIQEQDERCKHNSEYYKDKK